MLSVLWLFILVDITGLPILVMSLRSALRLVERYGVSTDTGLKCSEWIYLKLSWNIEIRVGCLLAVLISILYH